MEIKIKKVSKSEFKKIKCDVLFENKLTNRVFGILSGINRCYKFAWQSDLIEPLLLNIRENIFLIGIDQNAIIIDLDKNTIILKLSLFYNFYQAQINKKYIYIITELEIIKIDIMTFKVTKQYGLPDFFEKIEFDGETIKIHCTGNLKCIID